MSTRYAVLAQELLLFLGIQLLGIFAAKRLIAIQPELVSVAEISLFTFAAVFLVSLAVIFLAMRFMKSKFGFKVLFIFLIVVGARAIFSTLFSDLVAALLALGVVALWLFLPYVIVHNFALILAVTGISAELGFSLSFTTVLILLAVLSIYDVIAVYHTKHMVKMFTGLMNRGLLLSLVIPIQRRGWLAPTKKVRPKKGFLLLGTGDLAFPLIFAITALEYSLTSALFIAGGATVGAGIVFYLLVSQAQRRPLPALPPIAICSILGFFASLLI